MSDTLLNLAQVPQFRRLVKATGLPVPMPQRLARGEGPIGQRCLQDREIVVGGDGPLHDAIANTLAAAGANPYVVGDAIAPYRGPGEAYGRPPVQLDSGEALPDVRPQGLVFDASSASTPGDLEALYVFFHHWVGGLRACARVVVLTSLGPSPTPEARATAAALEGFVRSLSKEIGKRGSTANFVSVDEDARDRVGPLLRFLLSDRSAFITGQPLRVTAAASGLAEVPVVRALEGKVALVTGAARGIGAATVKALIDEGAKVVCLDRPADDGPLAKVAEACGAEVLLVDVTDPAAPERIRDALISSHGGVDIVVHNAGITRDKTLKRMDAERWNQVLDVNLGAICRITSALMEKGLRDEGRLVLLSSIAGLAGNFGQTNYAASKSGVIGYTRALAEELADRGITVNAVAPGFIETRLTAQMPVTVREVARRMNALSQGGLPVDIANAVTFLSSPGSQGVTGQFLRVCGGNLVGG